MASVFISHVEEEKEVALEIAHALEHAGVSVWYYERDSKPGLTYLQQITEAIDGSSMLIVVVSEGSMGSNQVAKEIEYAHDNDKRFLPVLFGLAQEKFVKRRKDWHLIFGAATTIQLGDDRFDDLRRIVEGSSALLKAIAVGRKPPELLISEPSMPADGLSAPEPVKPPEPKQSKQKPSKSAEPSRPSRNRSEPKNTDSETAKPRKQKSAKPAEEKCDGPAASMDPNWQTARLRLKSPAAQSLFDSVCTAVISGECAAYTARQTARKARKVAEDAKRLIPEAQVAALNVGQSGYGESSCVSPNGRYKGQLRDICRHGLGVHTWDSGETYQGNWSNDKRDGLGSYHAGDTGEYDGEWLDDMRHGLAVQRFTNQCSYEGVWAQNWPDTRGVCWWPNGDHFEGEWSAGQLTGNGIYFGGDTAPFSSLRGSFENGQLHGYGAAVWNDGTVTAGIWDRGNLNGMAVVFDKEGAVLEQGTIVRQFRDRLQTQEFPAGEEFEIKEKGKSPRALAKAGWNRLGCVFLVIAALLLVGVVVYVAVHDGEVVTPDKELHFSILLYGMFCCGGLGWYLASR